MTKISCMHQYAAAPWPADAAPDLEDKPRPSYISRVQELPWNHLDWRVGCTQLLIDWSGIK